MPVRHTEGPPRNLSPDEAQSIVETYRTLNALLGNHLSQNPFDPRHHYNYASYLQALSPDEIAGLAATGHGDSRFKTPDHPNRYVPIESGGFMDTLLNQSTETRPDPLMQILGALLGGL